MSFRTRTAFFKKNRISTCILIIEIIVLSILFLLILQTVRERSVKLAVNNVGDKVLLSLSSSIWKGVALIERHEKDLLAKTPDALPVDFSLSPPGEGNTKGETLPRNRIELGAKDLPILLTGDPLISQREGFFLPFSLSTSDGKGRGVSGTVRVHGFLKLVNSLVEKNMFTAIYNEKDLLLFDTSPNKGGRLYENFVKDFGTWKEEVPVFGISVAITAPYNAFPVPLMPQTLVVACYLVIVLFLVVIHGKIVKPSAMTLDMLRERMPEESAGIPGIEGGESLYFKVDSLLSAYRQLEFSYCELLEKQSVTTGPEIDQLRKNYFDLLKHHEVTKKMIKALDKGNIVPILLEGIKDLGFRNVMYGDIDKPQNVCRFSLDHLQQGKSSIDIPLLDKSYFFSRVAWSGEHHFVNNLVGIDLGFDESILLSNLPALILPVIINRRTKCYTHFNCAASECSAYMNKDSRCWSRKENHCGTHNQGTERDRKNECHLCPLFTLLGLIVVSSEKEGKQLTAQNYGHMIRLANEASLALEVADLYEETEKISVTDGLTGLFNHKEFYRRLGKELERSRRYGTGISLLMIDVDNFKIYNDTYGHIAGDNALKKIVRAIEGAVRTIDISSRYGGEEFTVILPETDKPGSIVLAERIKSAVGSVNFSPIEDESVHLTVSIGICSCRGELTSDQIVSRADSAAYLAKDRGKNMICISDQM